VGRTVCSTDTGNYCRARLQIPFQAVREIAIQLANDVEATVERDTVFAEQEACWLVELDIRSIKCSLGMDVIRGKTPEMVRTEFWSCLLAYNLIRAKMLQSCATSGRDPRSLSFTTTMQLLGTNWLLCAVIGVTSELAQLGQEASSSEVVGHRPDRVEPRVNKRRPKVLALMTKPRVKYHAKLGAAS